MTVDDPFNNHREIASINRRLEDLEDEKNRLLARKAQLEDLPADRISTSSQLSSEEKVALFQNLFAGRDDVYAFRWENSSGKSGYAVACRNEWQPGLCHKPRIKCGECIHRSFRALTAKTLLDHLTGAHTIGLYPLMHGDTCQLLAVDFDKSDWQQAAKTFAQVCEARSIPHAIERSRSGNGAHVWIFFEDKVLARDARRLGLGLLDWAMDSYPGLSFDSYDRLFPNQDSVPEGGFGNLIALPLQHHPRRLGNSVFVDSNLVAYPDQWQFLGRLNRLAPARLHGILRQLKEDKPEPAARPWEQGIPVVDTKIGGCPANLDIVLANQVFIPIKTLPSRLLAQLKRQASFANPVFFKRQALRFSTHGIPRYISLAHLEQQYLTVPRGCLEDVCALLAGQGIAVRIDDKREPGNQLNNMQLSAELRGDQKQAVEKLVIHDTGILHAPTAFGKTVTAIGIITQRKTNTLILTHTRQLVDQWKERLAAFLTGADIGVIAAGRRRPTGCIDIATYQSLWNRKEGRVDPLVLGYGQVVIDECHHISAPNYERLLSEVRARYVLGLTATPQRQDGHQPIVFMQAGPVRHRVRNDKLTCFEQQVIVRPVADPPPERLVAESPPRMADVYRWLMESARRNELIVHDVASAVELGSNPLVLTERREHARLLNEALAGRGYETVVLRGAMHPRERAHAAAQAQTAQVLIATGKYLGEGFDLPRLDTLFLALPISWKGSLAQYAGRIHRVAAGKEKVAIYDYVDSSLPMLQRMFQRRCRGYQAMGYRLVHRTDGLVVQSKLEGV